MADVRWYLDPARRGRDAYLAGHIPGAVFLDVDADLSAPGGVRGGPLGRHPWPEPAQVAQVMSRAGIGARTRVIAYDDQSGAVAARLWYVLRAHAHDAVAVLDGGLAKWCAEGRPLQTAVPRVAAASFHAALRPGWVVGKSQVAAQPLVLDARAPERFRGDDEPIDPRPGHIPGAVNAPFTQNLDGGTPGLFRPPDELRAHYRALGAERSEPVVYCGSGVTACHVLLGLHLAGLRGRLYPGSWSEWSSDPARPAATGDR